MVEMFSGERAGYAWGTRSRGEIETVGRSANAATSERAAKNVGGTRNATGAARGRRIEENRGMDEGEEKKNITEAGQKRGRSW